MPGSLLSRNPRRLVCVVEGQGEVEALPCLCSRIRDHLGVDDWFVDPQPIRMPRNKLVTSGKGAAGLAAKDGIRRAVTLASRRPADAVFILCDADDDCPATWGPQASEIIQSTIPGGAVMAVREYEAWLLAAMTATATIGTTPIDQIRGAKERLAKLHPGYKPTLHQLKLTQGLNLESVQALSTSFDKLIRTLAKIFGTSSPVRRLVP
jgi:hypothetical protein